MAVQVFVAATLRQYVSNYKPEEGIRLEIPKGTTVKLLLDMLGIPEQEVKVIMVNGVHASLDTQLEGNERIGLFPAVGGG